MIMDYIGFYDGGNKSKDKKVNFFFKYLVIEMYLCFDIM